MRHSRHRIFFSIVIYGFLSATVAWQGYQLVGSYRLKALDPSIEKVTIKVEGHVKKPGFYKVPRGTSQFEILKVAGVYSSSDLSPFNLSGQIDSTGELRVDSAATEVKLKQQVRMEFYFGEITVLAADATDRPLQEGMSIDEGDRVLTEDNSQTELSLGTYSRVDMDNFSELNFTKISEQKDNKSLTDLFQKTGTIWYRIAYAEKDEALRVVTPHGTISIGGTSADFFVEVKFTETVINALDGLLLIERVDGTDAMNLISGQSVTIYNDGRPFSVASVTDEMVNTDRFNQLTRVKIETVEKHLPFNILFCNPPQVFYLVSMQYDRNIVHVVQLPAATSVQLFVHGFKSLQESLLYGGPVFTTTLVERILNTRVQKFIIMEKDDIMRIAASIGGVSVAIDDKASFIMNLKPGLSTLRGKDLLLFLAPSISGSKDSEQRQIAVIRSIFEQLKNNSLKWTPLIADQILSNLETNISAAETMVQYGNFRTGKNWLFKNTVLPLLTKNNTDATVMDPDMEKCREILYGE